MKLRPLLSSLFLPIVVVAVLMGSGSWCRPVAAAEDTPKSEVAQEVARPAATQPTIAPTTGTATHPATQPVRQPATQRHDGCCTVPDGTGQAVFAAGDVIWNFRPTSQLRTPQHPVLTPRFPVVDIHCHWSMEQDPEMMLAAMDRLGVRAAVNLSGGFGDNLEAMMQRFHDPAPGRLLVFMNLDFDRIGERGWTQEMVAAIEAAHARGVSGLKIFKSLGLTIHDTDGRLVPVDDPRLDPIWTRCGELGMPVLIHSADPLAFFEPIDEHNERWTQLHRHPDWSFHGSDFPSRDEVLAQRNRMIARHPDTTFIGAHVANNAEDLARVARDLDAMPNLVADISGRVAELGRQPYTARRFFLEYQDRILFGTDRYPGRPDQPRYAIYYRFLETDDEYFDYFDHLFAPTGEWRIYGIFLPEEVLRKVYHENADRVLGIPVEDE